MWTRTGVCLTLALGLACGVAARPGTAFSKSLPKERAEAAGLETDQLPIDDQSPAALPAGLSELGLDDGFDFDLESLDVFDDLALLAAEDVVVSASRRLQRIEESPSAITVITREQIRAGGFDNLIDLMRLVPSADVHRLNQTQGAVGVRSRSTWGGDRMLVLLDGRDVALHLFGMPMWMSMPVDMDSIERVEIIRGPGSNLYGANALQGVVNIVSRKPAESHLLTEVTATMAGLNTASAELRAHGRTGSWGYWASAGWDSRAPHLFPEEKEFQAFRGRAFVHWYGRDEMVVRLETGLTHLTGEIVSFVGDGAAEMLWPYLLGKLSMRRSEVVAVVDWNETMMDLDLGLRLPDDLDGPPLATAPTLRFPARSAELTAHHTFDLFEGNTLMVGGSARAIHHMPGSLISCPPVAPADFDPEDCRLLDVLESRLGLFLQDEWHLRDDLVLNLGGRLDLNSLTSQPGFSPRAALVYSVRPGQALRLALGRAYRKPTFSETHLAVHLDPHPATPDDMALRLGHLFSRLGTPDLVNEYVDSLELGIRSRLFEDRLTVVLEGYASIFRHSVYAVARDIQPIPGFGGVPTIRDTADIAFENRGSPIWAYGAEFQVTGRPAPWLELSGSYALDRMHKLETDPDTGADSWQLHDLWEPHHRLIGSGRFKHGGWGLGLDATWFSGYRTFTRNPLSALGQGIEGSLGKVALVNAVASYRLSLSSDRTVEVGVTALNLFDQPYREVGGFDDQDGRVIGGGEVVRRRGRLFVRGSF